MALAIFIPNLAGIYQSILELYQTAIHPALSPKSGGSEWRVILADLHVVSAWISLTDTPNRSTV